MDTAAVRVIEGANKTEWNAFVAECEGGSLFHRADWEQVFASYRLPFRRLAAVRGGRLVGILPLVLQKSRMFGNQLVSLPWFDVAGVLAHDLEARDALIREARHLAQTCGARVIQLRHAGPLDLSPYVRTDKVLLRLALRADPDTLWKGFSPKVRNQVRKGRKSGLTVVRGGQELIKEFYGVYSANMRELGSPAHHQRFFRAIWDTFADDIQIYIVRAGKEPVGAGWTMANGDRLEIPWASSRRSYNRYCINHRMYWEILQDACGQGCSWFYFGRSSRNSGTYHFKNQWGAEPVELHWYYLAPDASTSLSIRPPQESYRWGTTLWRHLPLSLTRLLGPKIIAKLP